jgi:hypothetical protein
VQVSKNVIDEFKGGLQLFSSASGVVIVKLYDGELSEERIINKNSSNTKDHAQYALRLEKDRLPKDVIGENQPIEKTHKTPKQSVRTVIDIDQIRAGYTVQQKKLEAQGIKMMYTVEESIATTIAHELSHGVNVMHHGKSSNEPERTAYSYSTSTFHIYGSSGSEVKDRPFEVKGAIGSVGNDASGDLSCFMTYTSAYQWAYISGGEKILIYHAVPPLAEGKHLCTSAAGTGINKNGFFGNATYGNCLSQIKIKDN